MKIGSKDLTQQVYIVAEVGGNHNGSPEAAYRLVEEAAKAGADAVKFQTYHAETLVHPSLEPNPIVKKFYNSQLERFRSLELSWEVYDRIVALCAEHHIDFMTTPFDMTILERVAPWMPAIKIASGDLTYHQLITAAARHNKPVLVSTGMSTLDEIDAVTKLLPAQQLLLLHCVSVYPLPDEQANLRAITTMQQRWPHLPIGYSDHTVGEEACVAAVALGAVILEKHFTLDTKQSPGDHSLSLDPAGMASMVKRVRRVERMLGSGVKTVMPGEEKMRINMRRGIYAARDIELGEVLKEQDLLFIRPATDMQPDSAYTIVGQKTKRKLKKYDRF